MKTLNLFAIALLILGVLLPACHFNKTAKQKADHMEKGSYGYDKQFLDEHYNVLELQQGDSKLILVPEFQGRVMTSTCKGDEGFSFGWINYDLIASKKQLPQFNPFGGEERFWIGPEGGQFSIYFEKGKSFDFENWQVPRAIDTEPFQVVTQTNNMAKFSKSMELVNYSGTILKLEVERTINLLTKDEIAAYLGMKDKAVSMVAYQSNNSVRNCGEEAWKKETGLLSIWLLGMLIPSSEVTVIIPVKPGDDNQLGPQVNDDYFGKVSGDRLKLVKDVVFFKADGKSRGKIGIPPLRATRYMGSYDALNKALTIVECVLPDGVTDFVNSAWELQEDPYGGDALNSYNDGPLEDGSQMGPFYELESSSPALALNPQESYSHLQRTYHFIGEESELSAISEKLLGVSIVNVKSVFN
jgi:hypothetical protein